MQDPAPQAEHPAQAGESPDAKPAPSKARGIVKRIVGALVVFAVISIGGVAWAYLTGAPETAKAGDCLSGQSAEELKTVDCADATAEYKVVGKVENKTEAEFDTNAESICAAYPTFQTAYWEGKKNGSGYVLCLEPVK